MRAESIFLMELSARMPYFQNETLLIWSSSASCISLHNSLFILFFQIKNTWLNLVHMGLFLSPCPPHFFEPPAPSKQREAINFIDSNDSYQLRSEVTDGAFVHLLFFIALINYSMSWTQTGHSGSSAPQPAARTPQQSRQTKSLMPGYTSLQSLHHVKCQWTSTRCNVNPCFAS